VSIEVDKPVERSVDSIQTIYAVVMALAISQAIQSLLREPSFGAVLNLGRVSPAVPAFVAFLVTLVPFWHGMNRHLDRCYLEKGGTVVQGALLLDFVVFFLESSFLFAAGWSLRSGIESFQYLGWLLCVDMLWGFISHQIHFRGEKSHVVKWSKINLVALFLAILVVAYPFQAKQTVLMVVAFVRSVADYWFCWDFYFPRKEVEKDKAVLQSGKTAS